MNITIVLSSCGLLQRQKGINVDPTHPNSAWKWHLRTWCSTGSRFDLWFYESVSRCSCWRRTRCRSVSFPICRSSLDRICYDWKFSFVDAILIDVHLPAVSWCTAWSTTETLMEARNRLMNLSHQSSRWFANVASFIVEILQHFKNHFMIASNNFSFSFTNW